MRQVPALDASPFGIVGNGRVARHFQHYFTLLGFPVCTWARRLEGPGGVRAVIAENPRLTSDCDPPTGARAPSSPFSSDHVSRDAASTALPFQLGRTFGSVENERMGNRITLVGYRLGTVWKLDAGYRVGW